ncbi:hypothetical protein P7C70_g8034, partial [Phenoliferia sp. Uapishka_3]
MPTRNVVSVVIPWRPATRTFAAKPRNSAFDQEPFDSDDSDDYVTIVSKAPTRRGREAAELVSAVDETVEATTTRSEHVNIKIEADIKVEVEVDAELFAGRRERRRRSAGAAFEIKGEVDPGDVPASTVVQDNRKGKQREETPSRLKSVERVQAWQSCTPSSGLQTER